jgi:hypothetical protein
MLNAGLVRVVVTDDYIPKLWGSIFTNIKSHPDLTVSDSGCPPNLYCYGEKWLAATRFNFILMNHIF